MASGIGFIIILTLGQFDVTRLRLTQQVRNTSMDASLALTQMIRKLERADRIELLDATCAAHSNPGSCLQLRIPVDRTRLDQNAGYSWKQYRFDSGATQVRVHDPANPCTQVTTFFGISAVTIQYRDESPPPPGGDPPNHDNNVLELVVTSTGGNPVTYTDEVTIRAGAYTNLDNGLAPDGIALPPAICS